MVWVKIDMEPKHLRLRDYADAITENPLHHTIVLNLDQQNGRMPHDTMAWVALLVAQRLWGDLPTWDLDNITPEAWHLLKSKLAYTEWMPCIATRRAIAGITLEKSVSLEGYELWQEEDLPDDIKPKYLAHIDLLLWCIPCYTTNIGE